MDKDVEKIIVKSFIKDIKQDRVIYELSNKSKRDNAIWKIEDYVDDKYKGHIIRGVSSYEEIEKTLRKYGAIDECYVISLDSKIDGKNIYLNEALEATVFYGPALVSCIHGKLAYLEGETGIGAPNRFLLLNNNHKKI